MALRITLILFTVSTSVAMLPSAANACPPGMYQTRGHGWVSCAPMDGGGGPGWADDISGGEDEPNSDDYGDSGGGGAPRAAQSDYMARARQASQQVYQMAKLAQQNAAERERLTKDPRYQRYTNGAWDIIKADKSAGDGQHCVALFTKGQAIVSLVGPNPAYNGTLMIFSGPDVPRPKAVEKASFTLSQLGMEPQTVTAFSYVNSAQSWGSIAFAVPSVQAAIDGIDDVQKIEVAKSGKVVFKTDWSKGHAARDKWRSCMQGQAN